MELRFLATVINYMYRVAYQLITISLNRLIVSNAQILNIYSVLISVVHDYIKHDRSGFYIISLTMKC